MATLDADSFFTNIPLDETVKNQELSSNINKSQFEKLFRAAF